MTTFKAKILSLLNEVKGSGSFISHHEADFEFPGLEVEGVGELSYPINEAQTKALIKKAHKAPFGKGTETLVDAEVRSGWEIDADDLNFSGKKWNRFLNNILDQIKPDLGIEEYTISASLYKLLIYEKGDFFLPHQDTEKENGMFGTLIIALPARHSGGELLVRFDGVEKGVDFSNAAKDFAMPYAAFYADCEHEVKPVTSGYRICLVYNLVQEKAEKTIELEPLSKQVAQLADLLKQKKYDSEKPATIILLGHQYTPENYSMETLKLNDRPKADALLKAAEHAGYYAKIALVTSYLTGSPAYDGYYDGYDDGYGRIDDDDEMGEVHDESLSIEYWLYDGVPSLEIPFEEDDLIASFHLDDDEPIVKESTGYMGNWGPDIEHWYHYGAVVLWPKESHAALLVHQRTKTKLKWIDYFNRHINELTEVEVSAAESAMSSDLSDSGWNHKPDYTPVVQRLIHQNDERYFTDTGSELIQQYFVEMDTEALARLSGTYPEAFAKTMTRLMTARPEIDVFQHYLALLNAFPPDPELDIWKLAQIKRLPGILTLLFDKRGTQKSALNKKMWSHILKLEENLPESPRWIEEMAKLITISRKRKYINDVLVDVILSLKQSTPLLETVLEICREDVQQRVDNKPQPPANWSRDVPSSRKYSKQWATLAPFMESPDQQVFDYQAKQAYRSEMENAIRNVTIDLKMRTIRKGSPHTLRITKTQAAYERQMKKWEEDVELLEKVKKWEKDSR